MSTSKLCMSIDFFFFFISCVESEKLAKTLSNIHTAPPPTLYKPPLSYQNPTHHQKMIIAASEQHSRPCTICSGMHCVGRKLEENKKEYGKKCKSEREVWVYGNLRDKGGLLEDGGEDEICVLLVGETRMSFFFLGMLRNSLQRRLAHCVPSNGAQLLRLRIPHNSRRCKCGHEGNGLQRWKAQRLKHTFGWGRFPQLKCQPGLMMRVWCARKGS